MKRKLEHLGHWSSNIQTVPTVRLSRLLPLFLSFTGATACSFFFFIFSACASPQYGVPCSLAADGQEISSAPECGGKLLRRLWASPEPTLEPEPYMEEEPINLEEEARCAKDGGFVFATPSKGSAGECIEKQLVGCGSALELDVAFVTRGTPLFLLNKATNSLVFGLLVCASEEPATLDPGLATTSLGLPPGSHTPCPHQVR